ncbi:MAG: hypothetical protein Q8P89_03415 [bacterium]|nr:hypothetical protein [bacterium]
MKFGKIFWGIIFVLILSWWAVRPLFHPGFFPVHDNTQVVRVYEMAQALRDGQFPVRWVADLGYGFGYPIFNFYAPLPYYVGAIFNLVGLDALLATKLMFISGILLAGIFMYLLAREFWGELGGISAALFYMYAPYHAVDIYVRGAVGEFWAMAFLPLMAWGLYKVVQSSIENTSFVAEKSKIKKTRLEIAISVSRDQKSKLKLKIKNDVWKWVAVGGIGYAGVILSHNLTAMMTVPFLVIGLLVYLVVRLLGKEKRWKVKLYPIPYTLYPIFLALGLSAFYWLPAFSEMKFTNVASQIGGGADFHHHFVCFGQFWNSPWGFAGSAPGCQQDGMSFQAGKTNLVLSFVAFITAIFWWRRERKRSLVVLVAVFYLLLAIYLATRYSQPVWEAIAPMAYIQYPWRLLVFITLITSFLAGSIMSLFKNRFLALIFFVVLLASYLPYRVKYFKPQEYLTLQTADYISQENIKWKTSRISDEFLPREFPKPKDSSAIAKERIIPLDKSAKITDLEIKAHRYKFNITGENDTLIVARIAYFPGWEIFVDGKEKVFLVKNGQIFFAIPKGQHQAEVIFKNTPVRIWGNILSFLSFIILIGGLFYGRKKAHG